MVTALVNNAGTILPQSRVVSSRAGGKGRNPQTGEEITIKASKAARFRAGKPLKDALNA